MRAQKRVNSIRISDEYLRTRKELIMFKSDCDPITYGNCIAAITGTLYLAY
jgi:hypothetical protein